MDRRSTAVGLVGAAIMSAAAVSLAAAAPPVVVDAPCSAIGAVQVGNVCELRSPFTVAANTAVALDPGLSLHVLAGGSITVAPGLTFI